MKVREIVVILALALGTYAQAQQRAFNATGDSTSETPRFELGVAFSGIHLSENSNFGVGARAVYNFNSSFALEGEGNFFLNNPSPGILSGGRAIEGLFWSQNWLQDRYSWDLCQGAAWVHHLFQYVPRDQLQSHGAFRIHDRDRQIDRTGA